MSRKSKVLDILKIFDEDAAALQQQVISIRQNSLLSEEGKMQKANVIRDRIMELAKSAAARAEEIVSEARAALAGKGENQSNEYQVKLANALKIAELGASGMKADDVKKLIEPFLYDQLAYLALANSIRKNGSQDAIVGIPANDLPLIHKELDSIERYFRNRVLRFVNGGGSQWSGVVTNVNRDPFDVDSYSTYIQNCCSRLDDELTSLSSDEELANTAFMY